MKEGNGFRLKSLSMFINETTFIIETPHAPCKEWIEIVDCYIRQNGLIRTS